jgi:hypothetical protein
MSNTARALKKDLRDRAYAENMTEKQLFGLLITDLYRLAGGHGEVYLVHERERIARLCLVYAKELQKRGFQLKLI